MKRFLKISNSPPILALPYAGGHYTLDAEAYEVCVRFKLLSEQPESTRRPISYWFRSLKSGDNANVTAQWECLASVCSVLLQQSYLCQCIFTVRTDHDFIRWILYLTDASELLVRWWLHLYEFDFDIVHAASVKHHATDTLSRLPTDGTGRTPYEGNLPVMIHSILNVEKWLPDTCIGRHL